MAITFAVDDVKPASAPCPTRALRELEPDALLVGGDAETRVIDHEGVHPLLAAVHLAFAEHRPLVLSPDAIWITLAQGVAQHVRLNAERLRSRLVPGAGRSTIEVEGRRLDARDTGDVAAMVEALRAALAVEVGPGLPRLFVCDFSTTTPVDRLASEVVLLDAFAPYFDYAWTCICGIPEVTLLGTPADYRKIRERIDVVCELDLDFWRPSLVRIADELLAASEGRPEREFWRGIYKPRKAYGRERITGWSARLYPYVRRGPRMATRNPVLELPFDLELPETTEPLAFDVPGVTTDDVPATLSRVVVELRDETPARRERRSLQVEAGLTHVAQDAAGRLAPRAGFWVRPSEPSIHAAIARLRSEHTTAPPDSPCPNPLVPADVVALYDHLGAATLFEGPRAWRLRPLEWLPEAQFDGRGAIALPGGRSGPGPLVPLFDLPGHRILCATVGRRAYVLVSAGDLRRRRKRGAGECLEVAASVTHVPIVGRSLAEVLFSVLDGGPDVELPVLGNVLEPERRSR